jgi:hypothetical protein
MEFFGFTIDIDTGGTFTDRFSAFMKFEADGFSLGNHDSELKTLPLSSNKLLGRCIDRSAPLGPANDTEKATLELLNNRSIGNRFFITSEWEVPLGTPALNLHRVMQTLAASTTK